MDEKVLASPAELPDGETGRTPEAAAARTPKNPMAYQRFRRRVIAQVLLCAVPMAVLLGFGQAVLAGNFLWGIFGLMFIRLVILGRPAELLCLFLAVSPLLNLMKELAFTYQIVTIMSMVVVVYYASRSQEDFWGLLKKSPLILGLFAFVILYNVISIILTGRYEVNIRFFDLAFIVVVVLCIGRSREVFPVALLGLIISGWAIGLAMAQHIDAVYGSRLGIMMVEGRALGNPVSLGTPLALSFLGLTLDRGRWLNMESKPLLRLLLIIPTFILLALTTSRAAWLVTAGGLLVAVILDSRSRGRLLLLIGLAAVLLMIVLQTQFGDGLRAGIERTFSEERSTKSLSSGRSDQWIVSYYAFTASVGSVLHGYGPGLSPAVYAQFSPDAPGVTYNVGYEVALHSLYMQIAVETGLAGLIPFLVWLGVVFARNIVWVRRTKMIFPLVCFLGYLIIITTVSGNDSASGTFLGIGMLATLRQKL